MQPPDFGAEVCYVAIAAQALKQQQKWWYESAEVHCTMATSVRGWGPKTCTLLCLARGEQASRWAETVLQAVERLRRNLA